MIGHQIPRLLHRADASATRKVLAKVGVEKHVGSIESHIGIDETIRPRDKSAIFENSIEQCMEFAMRYFREARAKFGLQGGGFGEDWTKQYNIANEVKAIADGKLAKPGWTAHHNGGKVPPKAGDVISMQSPPNGTDAPPRHFHIAIVSDVFKKGRRWFARVYEANVPRQVNHPDIAKHYTNIPMRIKDGKFTLARVETSKQNYFTDMDVVGWLRPGKDKALPDARQGLGAARKAG